MSLFMPPWWPAVSNPQIHTTSERKGAGGTQAAALAGGDRQDVQQANAWYLYLRVRRKGVLLTANQTITR
jgi:hypothetical protein